MQPKTVFLIGFYKVDQINNTGTSTGVSIKLRKPKFITKSFVDDVEAKQWAKDNIEMFIPSTEKFAHRTFTVDDYVALGSDGRESEELAVPITDNIIANLNPILQHYCEEFWYDSHSYNFMKRLLGYTNMADDSDELKTPLALSRQSKYIADIFMKDCQKELAQFFRKITDSLLRTQIEHKIILFIKNGSVEPLPEQANMADESSLAADN